MILGVGVDVVEIADLRARMERTASFSTRVFDPSEISYCESMADPWPHFAARFAAKEAVMKALGTGWSSGVKFIDIVVRRTPDGKPEAKVKGAAATLLKRAVGKLTLSLSHSAGVAVAFAVLHRD